MAPADSGPTSSIPARSTRAIEPPPAPIVWISTEGIDKRPGAKPAVSGQGYFTVEQGHVCRCATHVKTHQLGCHSLRRDAACRCQAAGRTGQQQTHRLVSCLFGRYGCPGTLHDRDTGAGQAVLQTLQITRNDRPDTGIQPGGHTPFILPHLRQDFAGAGYEPPVFELIGNTLFLFRSQKGKQQVDRHRLNTQALQAFLELHQLFITALPEQSVHPQ